MFFHFINQTYRKLFQMKYKTIIYKIYNFIQKQPTVPALPVPLYCDSKLTPERSIKIPLMLT